MNWYKKAKNFPYVNDLVKEIDNVVSLVGTAGASASVFDEKIDDIFLAFQDLAAMNFEGFTKDTATRNRIAKLLSQRGFVDDIELLKYLRAAITMGDKVQESLVV
jgi:hypothetical protein